MHGVGIVLILCTHVIYAHIEAIYAALCPLGVVLNDLNVNESHTLRSALHQLLPASLPEAYCNQCDCKAWIRSAALTLKTVPVRVVHKESLRTASHYLCNLSFKQMKGGSFVASKNLSMDQPDKKYKSGLYGKGEISLKVFCVVRVPLELMVQRFVTLKLCGGAFSKLSKFGCSWFDGAFFYCILFFWYH